MSNKISAIYPVSWLTVNIAVTNNTTNTVDFSWVATEAWNTWVYNFTYTPDANTDYTWVATTPWYSDVKWVNFADWTSTWGISVGDIWNADIATFSNVPWSFGAKFANYGWVSHVINNKLDEETKLDITKLIEDIKNQTQWKWLTKEDVMEMMDELKSNINELKSSKQIDEWYKITPSDISIALEEALDKREKERILKETIDKEFMRFMKDLHIELNKK